MSVIRTLASTEKPLFSQASMSAAAAGTGSVCVSKRCLSFLPPLCPEWVRHVFLKENETDPERGQIGLGDRPGRQERGRPATGWHEDAVGRRTHAGAHGD